MNVLKLALILAACLLALAEIPPGVTPPSLIHKIEPKYTPDALAAGMQGTVVLRIMISEAGVPTNITVLSGLGFGLDEQAQAAVERWRFKPGVKDGKPLAVEATVEVTFRLTGRNFDSQYEQNRTRYNTALTDLKNPDPKKAQAGAKLMEELSDKKFPPAVYAMSLLSGNGDLMPKDRQRSLELLQAAADKNYGPALADLGVLYLLGTGVPRDPEKGLSLLRAAASHGGTKAQWMLGDRYEKGVDVALDADKAQHYFRLCAAAGDAMCQYRLGNLLLQRDPVQATVPIRLAGRVGNAIRRRVRGFLEPSHHS